MKTKGEALIEGLTMIREGLESVGSATGSKNVLLVELVGSERAAKRLRDVMGPGMFRNIIMSLVHAQNSRLGRDTVEKVVDSFLATITELSNPCEEEGPPGSCTHGMDPDECPDCN